MTTGQPIPSLNDYIKAVEAASFENYRGEWIAAKPEFEEIKSQVLARYKGVEYLHSFCDDDGEVFDFLSYDQDAALRALSGRMDDAPIPTADVVPEIDFTQDVRPGKWPEGPRENIAIPGNEPLEMGPPLLIPGKRDQFGNEMFSNHADAIAYPRLTIDILARRNWIKLYSASSPHRHAVEKFQVVNRGGESFMNVFSPKINWDDVRKKGQEFSLSQIWCSAGQYPNMQSIEAGWHVYPHLYADTPASAPSRLFVMMTPASYINGQFYYNEDKNYFHRMASGFVPGMKLTIGKWYRICWERKTITYKDHGQTKNGSGWWLKVNNEIVGYYPFYVFGEQGAMKDFADRLDFGGETVNSDTHTPFPAMGSGRSPNGGDLVGVAWHRKMQFWDVHGKIPDWRKEKVVKNYGVYYVRTDAETALAYGGPGGPDKEGLIQETTHHDRRQ